MGNVKNAAVAVKKKNFVKRVQKYWVFYILAIVPVAYLLVFRFWPILLQIVLSLKEYSIKGGIWKSEFVGLENFKTLFLDDDFHQIFFNTLRISILRLVCGFFPPIILAIMLFDMSSNKFRRISQSILYIPHFFSWVIVYGIVQILFQSTGYINYILEALGFESVDFLMKSQYFLPILIGSGIWKGMGWGTIIYLAALTGINTELFEAAKLDGAGPLQRIRYITLPGITGVIMFVLIMDLGKLLSAAGTEQILLFYNPTNYTISDVIGTWVYRQGLGKMQYSLGAAVSFFESTIGLILVLLSNWLGKKFAGVGVW
ncbi:MAG: sugar ABC transporter permease [Lachnospiraceae bacterium]|nr:sugar ABC transporter permease [Lachnospiraceae bacterium]